MQRVFFLFRGSAPWPCPHQALCYWTMTFPPHSLLCAQTKCVHHSFPRSEIQTQTLLIFPTPLQVLITIVYKVHLGTNYMHYCDTSVAFKIHIYLKCTLSTLYLYRVCLLSYVKASWGRDS